MNIFLYNILALNVPYYYNPNIHNFGNIGLGGKVHANLANQATKIIDNIRYNGKNIRSEIYEPYINNNKTILDLCCGVGISTPQGHIGIDTSKQMLEVAKKSHINTQFYYGNAETFRPKVRPDIVTCMFSFHEMPDYAQIRVINNALFLAKEEFIIVDIAPNYKNKNPPKIMLSGEPYLLDYLNNIENILYDFEETIYIPNRVHVWKFRI
mgnify:FL=1